jgi:hypothetical protein
MIHHVFRVSTRQQPPVQGRDRHQKARRVWTGDHGCHAKAAEHAIAAVGEDFIEGLRHLTAELAHLAFEPPASTFVRRTAVSVCPSPSIPVRILSVFLARRGAQSIDVHRGGTSVFSHRCHNDFPE